MSGTAVTGTAEGPARRVDMVVLSRAVARRWWVILLVVLLGAAIGVFASARSTPRYSARVTFYVVNAARIPTATQSGGLDSIRMSTLAALAGSSTVARRVVTAQKLRVAAGTVADETSASVPQDTVLLDVRVVDPSQRRALSIATGIARQLPPLVSTLGAGGSDPSDADAGVSLVVVSGPYVAERPTVPHRHTYALLGAVGGLLLGLAAAVLAEIGDGRVRTLADLEQAAGAPALGGVSFAAALEAPGTSDVGGRTAEELRQLRTAVRFLDVVVAGAVLTVAAPAPGGGATTVALQLARAVAAEPGRSVCVVDAHLRGGAVAAAVGGSASLGLSTVLGGRATLSSVVHRVADGFDVVPSGPRPPNPSQLLDSAAMVEVLAALRASYDLVLVDGPPVLTFADALTLGRLTDGLILTVRYGRTKLPAVASAARALRGVGVRFAGVVLTMAPAADSPRLLDEVR